MSTKKTIRYANAELRCTKCKKKDNDLQGIMVAHGKGPYVHFEDFKQMENLCKKLMKQHSDISCQNIRLRKAGDVMAEVLEEIAKREGLFGFMSAQSWHAAKEGKPTK